MKYNPKHHYHGKPCIRCGSTLRYKSNNNCAPCQCINVRKWRMANREKVRSDKRKWRRENPEKIRAESRRYHLANMDKHRKQKRRRRALKHQVKSEQYDFAAICNHYNNRCVKCGKPGKLTVDHIKPLTQMGDDTASNIQPLCHSCNSSKGARNIDYRPDAGPLRWFQKGLIG